MGKKVSEKVIGPACSCKKKCFTLVGDEGIKTIFKDYWGLKDYNLQTAELLKRIIKKPIKRKRTKKAETIKKYSSDFTVQFQNKKYIICKVAFISIYGISQSRITFALKKESAGGITIKDQRGKNPKK